jgi:hypothetical protein
MIPHWGYVMHHFLPQTVSRCYRLYEVRTPMKPHAPMGAAIAFRIVGTEFVSSCHAGLFRGSAPRPNLQSREHLPDTQERLCACAWAMAIHRRASAEILTVRLESSGSRCFTRSRETLLGRASSGISTPSREFHTTMPSWLMSQTGSLLSPTLVKMLPNEAVVRKEHHAKWNLLKDLGSQ